MTLVVGKGGVGRTTVARALAFAAVQQGERAICVELAGDAGGGSAPPGSLVLDPADAVEAAATPVFGSRRIARALLGNFAIQRLFDVVPAIHEYALLVAALELTRTYARVVVDLPATGHGVAWLGIAGRLARLVPSGVSHDQAARLDAALRAPVTTALVVVTLPEPIVLAETRVLRSALRAELGRDADLLVVNRVPDVPVGALQGARALGDPAAAQLAAWLGAREQVRTEAGAAAEGIAAVWLADHPTLPPVAALAAELLRPRASVTA